MLSPDSILASRPRDARADVTVKPAPLALRDDQPVTTINEHAHGDDHHHGPAVTVAVSSPAGGRLLDRLTSEERKEYPITTGVLDYFPDAVAAVAHISYLGNAKHNPGQPLHWSRGKSSDHEDCISRHTIQRDTVEDNVMHAANRAWRALASLQEMLEAKHRLGPPRGAR